ncbi:MAG: hypothetical protein OXG25_12585 [Gammaproteobacteria bacterium]|nr:hypothetical protein [Gammaproteobacteria bacterium]
MFDNPFDSFHNAVAEAKEEREQLDRLLTISTPRERLLVIVIAVAITAFAVWLFLGQVTRSVSIEGTLTFSNETAQSPNTSTQAKVSARSSWLTHEEIRQISSDLSATIEITKADGETLHIHGKVSDIVSTRVAEELQLPEPAVEIPLYRVFFTSDKVIDTSGISDRECRIAIELYPQSPLSLFGLRRV